MNEEPAVDGVGLHAVLMDIRRDLTRAQGKLTEALRVVGNLDLGEAGKKAVCPQCGVPLSGPRTLAEHVYVSHGGPLPEHYRAVDELVAVDAEEDS